MTPAHFWSRVVPDRDCWLWTGMRDGKGRGLVKQRGRRVQAHRYAWRLAYGEEIAPGVELRSRCGRANCVNPAHRNPVAVRR